MIISQCVLSNLDRKFYWRPTSLDKSIKSNLKKVCLKVTCQHFKCGNQREYVESLPLLSGQRKPSQVNWVRCKHRAVRSWTFGPLEKLSLQGNWRRRLAPPQRHLELWAVFTECQPKLEPHAAMKISKGEEADGASKIFTYTLGNNIYIEKKSKWQSTDFSK